MSQYAHVFEHQLMVLFRKAAGLLQGGALPEGVCYWWQELRFGSLVQLFAFFHAFLMLGWPPPLLTASSI